MSKQDDIAAAKALLAKAEAEVEVAAPAPVVVPVEAPVVATEPEVDTAWLDAPPGLDRSRSFGTVWDGSGTSKARYQQDGKFYGYDGALIKE